MKLKYVLKFALIVTLSSIAGFMPSQNDYLDSLNLVLKNTKDDTIKIHTLHNLYLEYRNTNPKKAKEFIHEGYLLATKSEYKKGIADFLFAYGLMDLNQGNYEDALTRLKAALQINKQIHSDMGVSNCLNTMGNVYRMKGEYLKAIDHLEQSLAIRKKTTAYIKIGDCYNNLGNVYRFLGDYQRALSNYLKASVEYEKAKSEEKKIMLYNNLGTIYEDMEKFDQALDYYRKALNDPDKLHVSYAYNNIGSVHIKRKMYNQAVESFLLAIKVSEEIGNKESIALALINISRTYLEMEKLDQSMKYSLMALKLAKELGDKGKLCDLNVNIASILEKQKKFESALKYADQALVQAQEVGSGLVLTAAYEVLSSIHKHLGNYKKSLAFYKLFMHVNDSLLSKDKTKSIYELQSRYEADSKEKEILLLTKDNQLKERSFKEQRIMRSYLISGVFILSILSFTLYKRYRFKQKSNLLLEAQKKEIEVKNLLITDSIDYAKTIQDSVLPNQKKMNHFFPDSFTFYKPKDIVSGDFYWIANYDRKTIFAVADCSGHGVPGAFMSLLGSNMLENVIKKKNDSSPAEILDSLNNKVIEIFEKRKQTVKTRIDISLITIDTLTMQLEYAGAYHSLYIIRDGEFSEIKANEHSLGLDNADLVHFLNHSLKLKKNDMIYLFSDGYADQIGGLQRKKFHFQNFRELLFSIHQLGMSEQVVELNTVFTTWKGECEQTDDVLIAGIKIS